MELTVTRDFSGSAWKAAADVRDFILSNYMAYNGDSAFLQGPTNRTKKMWERCRSLLVQEIKKGVLDLDVKTVSTITSHKPGYIDKDNECIVGLQTDAPLKRAIKPYGGIRTVMKACESYGYKIDPAVVEIFTKYRKTHNDGVFDIYNQEIRTARSNHIITGLPDGYGRGRIIGDYRRIALYGVDQLIAWKEKDKQALGSKMDADTMLLMEEISEQVKALKKLKELAGMYGCDVSRPAQTAKEAIQGTYFGYLASVKEQDGAAMSFGRVDSFFDIYLENDIKKGLLTEEQAQELIDDFVVKLRLIRHLRTPEYNQLFAGDPTWITMVLGGMSADGRPLVTKTSFRILQTLYNLGPSPEPNITIVWSQKLPKNFKEFCAQVSIDTSSIQYENDDIMRPVFGDDYGIACCVSGMTLGKDMQFFGARCNLAKLLLYTLNEGKDEMTGEQVAPKFDKVADGVLKFENVKKNFEKAMDWLTSLYVNTMNSIHYSHDKYCYEAMQMALHDSDAHRYMAFGVAGLSVVADSLSAIKYAKVTPIRNEKGIAVDFKIEGEFPKYGNDDDRVDQIAVWAVEEFIKKLKKNPAYRDAEHTLSVLTITSNVVYGENTGTTPDGRKAGEPFAPGANPMHGRDTHGAIASLNTVAKLPYKACKDGISNTFSIVPSALGKTEETKLSNLVGLLDGYFSKKAHHLNVNVLTRETLLDAMAHPEKYPQLTIRVSGYAVNFVRLSQKQQKEVLARTFHDHM